MRRVECLTRRDTLRDRPMLAVNVWYGKNYAHRCRGVDIIDERDRPEFETRVLTPALAALNCALPADVAPVTLEEVRFDG